MEPRSLATSDSGFIERPVVLGRDVVRLDEDGTWATLIKGNEKTSFNSAHNIRISLDVLAVGDSGRIVHYSPDGIEHIETNTTANFVAGWAQRHRWNVSEPYIQLYAISARGTIYASDSQGNHYLCPAQIENPVAILDPGMGSEIEAITANGSRFVVYHKKGSLLQCPHQGLDGEIIGAKNLYCGIFTNLFAWNEKEIFANKEASCAVD